MAKHRSRPPAPAPRVPSQPRRGPPPRRAPRARTPAILLVLFFVSGTTGLLYEVLFARLLALVMGSTVYALTTVLTVFMGGLGLGAYLGGRRAASLRDPVRAYGYCELGIASSLLVPVALTLMSPLFRKLYVTSAPVPLRYALLAFPVCALLLLVPTTLMGATLPLLVEGLARRGHGLARSAGTLYAVNTMGAFAGALGTGFLLLPRLGQTGTLVAGAVLNVLLCLLVLRRFPVDPSSAVTTLPSPEPGPPGTTRILIAVCYAASGFAAMAYQIGWTRAAALSIGSSTYTFSLIVAAFIFGLALGAFLLSRAGALIDRAPWLFGALQIAIGAAAALLLPVLGELPIHAYDLIGRNKDSFARLMAVELLMLFAIVAVPTMMMGALFPLSARMLASGGAGRAVGAAYGANTAGSIAGAFLAGFALLPAFGVRGTLLFASGINVAFGCLALALATPVRAARVGAAALLLAAAWPLGARLPAWNQTVLASEPYLLKASFKERLAPEREGKAWSTRIVFFRDDPDVTVAVEQIGDGCVLRLNGKADASTFVDMPTQRLLGHLPMLLHGHARTACVIGMGSGASAGAVSVYPGLERVDVVEIARSVIEAAHHFDEVNHQILASPRARFLLADGRTHLRFTPETYDVIVSEPSNPWIAGIGKLFTVEMFRECRARLSPGGVMAAWLQSYRVSREAVAVVLRSFERVFPNVTVWTCSPGDLLLVGVNGDATLDLDRVRALIADPAIASDMSALRIEEPADLVPHLLMGSEDVRRFTAGGSRVNTDDNGWLELAAPRTLHLREDVLRAADCFAERRPLPSELPFAVTGADGERSVLKEKLGGILEAERSSLLAQDALDAGDLGTAEEAARRALAKNPHDLPAALALGDVLISRTRTLVDASRFEEAAPLLTDLSRVLPNDPQLPYDASTTFIHLKRPADALPFLDRLKRAYPADLAVRGNRALALCEVGRFADAREDAAEIVAQRPGDPRGSFLLARALVGEGKPREALALLDPILAKDPGAVEPRYLRAQAARALGDVESAVRELEAIQDKKPEARAEAVRILNSEAERLARIGQEGAAASARERAARLESQGPGI